MERPIYLQRLLRQKVLLIVGLVVAIAAGLLAGFTIVDGEVVPRATRTYTAGTTILLARPNPEIYQVEIPGQTQVLTPEQIAQQQTQVVVQEPSPINLSSTAVIMAYLASSDAITDAVATQVGGLEPGDGISAVSRTTQPPGDEEFPGRLSLPIVDVMAVSTSAARAELLSDAATVAFQTMVLDEQNARGVPENIRLTLDVLNAPVADEGEGSNPAIPVVIVAVGVFLLFLAAALIIEAIRDRRRRAARPQQAEAVADETDEFHETDSLSSEFEQERVLEPVGSVAAAAPAGYVRGRRRARVVSPASASVSDDESLRDEIVDDADVSTASRS